MSLSSRLIDSNPRKSRLRFEKNWDSFIVKVIKNVGISIHQHDYKKPIKPNIKFKRNQKIRANPWRMVWCGVKWFLLLIRKKKERNSLILRSSCFRRLCWSSHGTFAWKQTGIDGWPEHMRTGCHYCSGSTCSRIGCTGTMECTLLCRIRTLWPEFREMFNEK